MAKTLIILGSARGDGNTAKAAQQLESDIGGKLVDLLDYRIAPYHYENAYPENDEFIAMAKRLVIYDRIVFASPVYWYSMSGVMKDFFDRLTDLLTFHKDIGRRLRGKQVGVLSCSAEQSVNPGFYEPFRLTADYLGMSYGPEWHGWVRGSRVDLQLVNN
ncbi:MAG: NAD(P)H-dependent oxidoreductase [Lewinella sp.]